MACSAGGMSQHQQLQTAWQLAKAVQHLHDRHMLHLDIKLHDVLLDDFDGVVLANISTSYQMQPLSHSLPSANGTNNIR